MLPIEAKTETTPAALEVDWISGTASRPTVALRQQLGFNDGWLWTTYHILTTRAQ